MFYMPVKVFDEEDCINKNSEELSMLGNKAMLVTGRNSARKCGALQDITKTLNLLKISWVEFCEVEENPSVETVMKARDIGIAEKVDFIIGIGGGSPLDAAKAIALMIKNNEKSRHYLFEAGNSSDHLPLAMVPTTCGTGSEVTPFSILTNHATQSKGSIPYKIFPDVAFIDGKYLRAAPRTVLANTTMDAFAHLVESYINTKATDYSQMFVNAGLEIWKRSKDIILGERKPSDDDYKNMLLASTMAGIAITHTGTSLPHALSYRLTYTDNIAHGRACGCFLKGFLNEADSAMRSEVLGLVGFKDIEDLQNYYVKTCGALTVSKELLEQTVRDVMSVPEKLVSAPFETDKQVLRRIAGISSF
jgi:alcohol dehydrogenase class IV